MHFWKVYAILVSLILIGMVCIVLSNSATLAASTTQPSTRVPQPAHWWDVWPTWVEALGSTLLIAGTLGVIERTFVTKATLREIREIFRVHETVMGHGIHEVSLNAGNYDYGRIIRNSVKLQIVMNDGRTWVSSRIDQIQERFSKDGLTTEVFVIDPESQFAKIIADKTGYSLEAQKLKIQEASQRFIQEFELAGKKGVLRLYFLKFFPTHSVVVGDSEAVLTLYGISTRRGQVPTIFAKETGNVADIFCLIRNDVERLRSESQLHFDSTAQPVSSAANRTV